MVEDRIGRLEATVSDLRVENAELTSAVTHLAGSVKGLDETVQSLRDTMNRGRGALWGIGGLASVLGGAAAIAAEKLLGN